MSYVDPFSAASAVEWFNGKEFKGACRFSVEVPEKCSFLKTGATKLNNAH